MTTDYRQAIADLLAFIQWAERHKCTHLILPAVQHDLAGLISNERCFEPRSVGYAAMLAKEKAKPLKCPRCDSPLCRHLIDNSGHWEMRCTACTWAETTS